MTALAALTERIVLATLRNELPIAIVAPAGDFVIFNFLLGTVIDTGGMSYPQYLLPVILVQLMFLGALTTVERAAQDQQSDFGVRLRTLPISTIAPLMARMSYCLLRGALGLFTTIAVGYALGFRMFGGFVDAAAFVALFLAFTLALSLAADATGTRAARGEVGRSGGSSQLLLVPEMLLVLLSTGMAPVDSFPDWLHPFVRYQPVSQLTETLRGFTTGHVVVSNLATSVALCLGLLVVFGVIALRMQRRTQ